MTSQSIFYKPSIERQVVVTGMAAITPLGLTKEELWPALLDGHSGIAPITRFDPSGHEVTIAGEVKGFTPEKYIEAKDLRRMERFTQMAVVAGLSALEDSGLDLSEKLLERTGCLIGVGMGGLECIAKTSKILETRGPSRVSPFFIPKITTNMAPGYLSLKAGLKGPSYAITSACGSGTQAIGEAMRHIRHNVCDVVLAGGTESTITPLAFAGFTALRSLSLRNTHPKLACRPYDRDRDGFVLSEGCGVLVLEDYEMAAQRGARIYCKISGYGDTCDAFHITSPDEDGRGAVRAMQLALNDARCSPESIDYINAHGTSTPLGDEKETLAIKKVFGMHAKKLSISSTKSMIGHLLGAAGAVEAVCTALSIFNDQIHPTINLENPSPECDLNYTPHAAVKRSVQKALSNSFGFGGTNTCLVFEKT